MATATEAKQMPGIPRTYEELYHNFGPFIAGEVRKANTVTTNFEEALHDVWAKLLEAEVLERFGDRVGAIICPDVMTATEACEFLGISWDQWMVRQWGYHKGTKIKGDPNNRKIGKWMPTPIQKEGAPPGSFVGYQSQKARFHGKDIERLIRDNDDYGWKNQGMIHMFTAKPTAFQFLNYLGQAVRNHFANFCRTRDRKWRDRSGDCVLSKQTSYKERKASLKDNTVKAPLTAIPKNRLGANAPSFHTAEGAYDPNWENSIADNSAEARIDAQLMVRRTLERLSARGVEEKDQHDICLLLASGYTLAEAITKSDMPTAKKKHLLASHERNDLVLSQRFVNTLSQG